LEANVIISVCLLIYLLAVWFVLMISQKIVNALGLNFQGKFTLGWLRNDQIFDLERPQEGEFLVIDLCS